MIRETKINNRTVYFLADDMGHVWLGGWYSKETAEERLEQAEACDWDADRVDCSVDVQLDEAGEAVHDA